MPFYKCKVVDSLNQKKIMVREAEDEVVLKANFKADGLFLVHYSLIKEKTQSTFFSVSSKVKREEVINFLRQFAVMVKAGIPINDCINTLRGQKYSAAFKKVLQKVYFDIESGVLLSEAFRKHPKVFPQFFTNMVSIGEVSGSLDRVLTSMADYYENDRKVKRKARSAMIYPTFLFVLTIVVALFINLFILPQFEDTINELGGEIPQITIIVMSISNFIKENIYIIVPVAAAIVFLVWIFFKTQKGRYVKDFLLFHLPVISRVERDLITARFSKAFMILLDSGMTMVDCLENLKKMLGNKVFEDKFSYTIEEVKRGRRIAPSLAATKIFPDMLTEMINVGEQSGNIEEVLRSSGNYFDECVESSITRAIATLEPMMILFLGAVVAVVILAVLVPMIALMNSI